MTKCRANNVRGCTAAKQVDRLQFAVRMTGHTKEVEMGSRIPVSQYHKSAITDCVCYNNLIMDY